ncbi:uncharacterized protein [Miscanthus floridulus]|uniref:uncharacterized protein n=1 Tax=Miscanthus floridulus TaxID=154761 RepID=UPI003459FA57
MLCSNRLVQQYPLSSAYMCLLIRHPGLYSLHLGCFSFVSKIQQTLLLLLQIAGCCCSDRLQPHLFKARYIHRSSVEAPQNSKGIGRLNAYSMHPDEIAKEIAVPFNLYVAIFKTLHVASFDLEMLP